MIAEHVGQVLTETIYKALFGKSRAELLAIAKMLPNYGTAAGLLYPASDEDECMKDCFNIQALQALNDVEAKMTEIIVKLSDSWPRMNEQEKAAGISYIVLTTCEKYVSAKGVINPFEGE